MDRAGHDEVRASAGGAAEPVGLDLGAATSGVDDILELARKHLDLDVVMVGRIVEGRREVRAVAAGDHDDRALVGSSRPVEETHCHLVSEGLLPPAVPDLSAEDRFANVPAVRELGIRTHLGVPVVLPDGSLYGTLCGFSRTVRSNLSSREVDVVRFVSEVVARHVLAEEAERRHADAVRRDVEQAVHSGDHHMVFQPIVHLETGELVGVEALSRFAGASHRRAHDWFVDAEIAGLGPWLEATAIRRAVEDLPRIPSRLRLSVNVSAQALCSEEVTRVLADAPLDQLVIEVTEYEEDVDMARLLHTLEPLRSQGAKVALDDIGAGYAGLERVVRFNPDRIKLDRALVMDVDSSPVRRALMSSWLSFADTMQLELVAEGIETDAEVDMLRHLGVAQGQGFYFGEPGALDDVIRLD